jgi:hypothetical protein
MGRPEPPDRTTAASTTTLSLVSQEERIVRKIAEGAAPVDWREHRLARTCNSMKQA